MAQVLSSPAARLLQVLSLGIAALLGAAGCGSSVEEGDDVPGPAAGTVQVGSGSRTFKELGANAEITVVAGAQGGYHIWLSARCADCGPEVTVRYGVEDAGSGELLSYDGLESWAHLEEDEDGWREVVGMTAFLNGYSADEYLDRRVRLWATIVDPVTDADLDAEAEATVTSVEYDDNGF